MKKFLILIPIYNDWKSVFKLLDKIELEITTWDAEVSILIINDASIENRPEIKKQYKNIKLIRVMNMKRNQGHARCNATGLKFIMEKEQFDHVILMDGDGEDRPEELSLLYEKSKKHPDKIVTADRVKRSEGLFFKLLYECHKILTYIFTGKYIRFGNFTCLPRHFVMKIVKEESLWSSYSGTVAKVVFERTSISSERGKRYFGPSQMNFFKLLLHSFSIIAVFKGSVIIRSAIFIFFYLFFISKNFSIITLFPVVAVTVFLFLIFNISTRENFKEFENALKNIENVEVLSSFDSRQ
jgi:glycosyltransferase involved in cell wall biosynthesis